MGIKLKQFLIVLDQQKMVYVPGDLIQGECLLELEGQMDLCQLTIKIKGLAECRWEESRSVSDSDGNSRTETDTYYDKQELFESTYSPGNVYPTVLDAGKHKIGFNFIIPNIDLPNSFQGAYGHVSYYVKARIHKMPMFSIDNRITFPITVCSPIVVPIHELSPKVMNSGSKTVGLFAGKKLSIECYIPRAGYKLGSSIPVHCFVDNHSKKSMILRATLKQEVTFTAHHSTKKSLQKFVQIIGNTIGPKSQQKDVLTLTVPDNIPLLQNSCRIIKVQYIIVVTLDIPGSIDLHCILPVILTDQQLPIDF